MPETDIGAVVKDRLGPAAQEVKDAFLQYIPEDRREEFSLALWNIGTEAMGQMIEAFGVAMRTAFWETPYPLRDEEPYDHTRDLSWDPFSEPS